MSFSMNEVQSFATHAARGAGFPVAQSSSFGRAAAWHIALGRDTGDLEQALRNPGDSPILRLPLILQDIERLITLSGPEMSLSLHPDDIRLMPSYLRLLPRKATRFDISKREDAPPLVHLALGAEPSDMTDMPARLQLPTDLLGQLQKLAAKRLVPASEQSRKGAGA